MCEQACLRAKPVGHLSCGLHPQQSRSLNSKHFGVLSGRSRGCLSLTVIYTITAPLSVWEQKRCQGLGRKAREKKDGRPFWSLSKMATLEKGSVGFERERDVACAYC